MKLGFNTHHSLLFAEVAPNICSIREYKKLRTHPEGAFFTQLAMLKRYRQVEPEGLDGEVGVIAELAARCAAPSSSKSVRRRCTSKRCWSSI